MEGTERNETPSKPNQPSIILCCEAHNEVVVAAAVFFFFERGLSTLVRECRKSHHLNLQNSTGEANVLLGDFGLWIYIICFRFSVIL